MGLNDTGLVRLITEKMGYLGQKQAVLAQNIANANTPGYKAKELTPFSFDTILKETQGGMTVTNANHIIPASMAGVNAATKRTKSYETVPSGNSVDLEQQMMDSSQTAIDYQSMAAVYHKVMGLFRTALGK